MKISIITPVYNDPRVERCLDSVHSQQGEFELEHIVVDGMSDDRTVDVINQYMTDIDCLIREDDDGVYDAMNTGISQATGDIVGILNSDDRYQDESVLSDVCGTMMSTGADTCYGDLVYVDDSNEVVRYWQSGEYKKNKFYLGWMPPHPTFFVRSEIYDEFGRFRTDLPIAADYELMLRFLFIEGVSTSYLDRVLVRMSLGGQSNESIGNMLQAVKEMYRSWCYHQEAGRYTAPLLHPVEKVPQYIQKPPQGV